MAEKHQIARVRHETRHRLLTVRDVRRVTPHMVRVTLGGEDLAGFRSAGFDDHIKLRFPVAGHRADDPEAPVVTRDFTPRRFDTFAQTLTVDFALHASGPAAEWAAQARPGQQLRVGGPRGSMIVPDDFDWYLLVGDEAALAAIGRRLEELRPGVSVLVLGVVEGLEEEQRFESATDLQVFWAHRPLAQATDPEPLLDKLRALRFPEGDGFVWVACEASVARRVRQHLVDERGLPKPWVKASGYWRQGATEVHDRIED